MKLILLLLTFISFQAQAFTELSSWNVCQSDNCKEVVAGDDLFIKHKFEMGEVTYSSEFKKSNLSCVDISDCWLFLGSVGDTAVVKLNGELIGNFDYFIHYQSLKLHIPLGLLKETNRIEVQVKDLNQTRFGLRSPDVGIGSYNEVTKRSIKDWLLRTGSPLISGFTLFVLLLGMSAVYGIYKNKKILPVIFLCGVSLFYLISFSEMPRAYLDPVYMSGPVHFILRLGVELCVVIVALRFYKLHSKIKFLEKLPYAYAVPMTLMFFAWVWGLRDYSFYKTIMLIVAPLVAGGGTCLVVLSYFYYDRQERKATFPLFLGLFVFQVYDLLVFWEVIPGAFTIKWYLPFMVMAFIWIYFRRRIFEIRTLKIDAIVGDEVRKLAHDLAAPIQNLVSLASTKDYDLISRNVKELESLTEQVLGRYHRGSNVNKCQQGTLIATLSDIQKKFQDKIEISFDFSMEFDWYCTDVVIFTRTFTNLISNSIKARATEVKIHGYYKNSFLTIDVTDNGQGIPCNLQPYIFDKGITSNKNKGNGLGLSFIKEKFNELGFDIKLVKSSIGGTIFRMLLPLKEIVLIDDNALVRDTWTALAEKAGMKIKTYSASKDVEFKQFSKNTPFFIDHELKEENGLKVVHKLLKQGFTNVILATGETRILDNRVRQIGKEFPSFFQGTHI